jgi:hypothetical protein
VRCLSSDRENGYITCVFSDGVERKVAYREIDESSEVYTTNTHGRYLEVYVNS